jgi:cytochrome c556
MVAHIIAALVVTVLAAASVGGADAQTPAPPGATGISHPHDMVLARRVLMTAIGHNMDEITGMVEPGGKLDLHEATELADAISTMLLAFPHLFSPETDTWSKELEAADPGRVSLAKSKVWQTFDDFYARAQGAARAALDASYARNPEQFRERAQLLQNKCDSCHADYRRQ